jgi:hypothetical protein
MSTIDPLPPSVPPPTPPRSNERGSLGLGVGLAWAVVVVGYVVCLTLAASAGALMNGGSFVVFLLLPWLAVVALAVFQAVRGRPRTALGIVIGIASIFAVGLLLVAACFGLIGMSGGFH